jgi:RNA polymerase sigma factor (sigma-70 family)
MPPPIDPERLLAQTAWVRRLALSLTRDEASADDLVQETFVAALRRPPPDAQQDASLRAWIAHVLRNLAFRRKREEYRREQRERQRAPPARSDEESRARELEELRTELFEHVVALPESSRQLVLLRYFEELDSAQIARRLDLPDSTVRNRLRRALAELRERLERKHGSDWRRLCLFALPGPALRQAATGAAVAAAGGLWLGVGSLAVLALLVFLAWPRDRSTGPVPSELALPSASVARSEPDSTRDRSADSPPRRAEAEARDASPGRGASEEPATLLVQGSVLDELGQPASDYRMEWIDERGTVRYASLAVENFVLENAHPGKWMVALSGVGWQSEQSDVVLDPAPFVQRREFRMHRTRIVPVRLVDQLGRSLVQPVSGGRLPWQYTLKACATTRALPDVVPPLLLRDPGEFRGSARFWDLLSSRWNIGRAGEEVDGCLGYLELFDDPPLHVALVDGNVVLAREELQSGAEELTFVVAKEELAAKHQATRAGLKLHVVLPGGAAARECWVLLDCSPPADLKLGPDGRGVTLDLPPGPTLATLDCRGYTRTQLTCELVAGEVRDLGEIQLVPQRWLFVHFELPPDANDFVRFSLERATEGAAWTGLAGRQPVTQKAFAGKRERVPWPGSGSFVLRVEGIGEQPPPGNSEVRNDYHAGARPLRFELDAASPDEISVQIVHTQRVVLRPPADASRSARWFLATDEGLPCRSLLTEGRTPLALELAPGGYELSPVDEWTGALGNPQSFTVGTTSLAIDLRR